MGMVMGRYQLNAARDKGIGIEPFSRTCHDKAMILGLYSIMGGIHVMALS